MYIPKQPEQSVSGSVGQPPNLGPTCIAKLFKFSCFGAGSLAQIRGASLPYSQFFKLLRYKRFFFSACLFASSFVCATDVPVEFKAGYFYPTDHRFREIYPTGGPIFGLEVSCQAWKQIYPWASVNYFAKSGRSIIPGVPASVRTHTRIEFVPLQFGLKYLQQINSVLDLYFGLGALATYLHLEDQAPYVIQTSAKWGGGGIAKVGGFMNWGPGFFLDIAVDYSYMVIDFDSPGGGTLTRQTADISGFSFGLGLGYRFGYQPCKSD